jgi:DNA-binding transcriptional regulator YbjK
MGLARRRKARAESIVAETPRDKPADVRSRLLLAADDILVSEGIQAITQTRVSEVAGVRQSHLTYYFATRSTLIKAIMEFTANSVLMEFTSAMAGGRLTVSGLRQRLVDRLSDWRIARRLMGILVSADEDPSLLTVLDRIESQHCDAMAQMMRQLGIEFSQQDAMLMHASLIGILMRHCNRNSIAARQQVRELISEAFDRIVAHARASAHPRNLSLVTGRQ